MNAGIPDQIEADKRLTLENREKLARNRNLLHWYEQLYRHQFEGVPDFPDKRVLEIGSGTSPIKRFHPHVLTSDILELDHLDFVFDCHDIDAFDPIPDASLDVITLTNVLHHLRDPIDFLKRSSTKLKPGGRLIATEPYFSLVSSFIYRHLHHEPVDMGIKEPKLCSVEGPLASANIALPFLIFRKHPQWTAPLEPFYKFASDLRPFTALAYMVTGGISRSLPVPPLLYRSFFAADRAMALWMPRLVASFFTIELVRSPGTPAS